MSQRATCPVKAIFQRNVSDQPGVDRALVSAIKDVRREEDKRRGSRRACEGCGRFSPGEDGDFGKRRRSWNLDALHQELFFILGGMARRWWGRGL